MSESDDNNNDNEINSKEELEQNEEQEQENANQDIINIEEPEEKKPPKKKESSNSQTQKDSCNGIFINGIPYETTEEELKNLFSPYGEIKLIKLPKYQDSGRNIGYGHIYFTTAESASKSLELDNHTIGKRYLKISLAKKSSDELNKSEKINPNNVPVDCLTAFIRNLPYEISEKEVGDKFRSCGKIKSIRMVYNSKNKKFKGFCYIDFKEHNALLKALELNGKDFMGRMLQVDYEQKKPKKGYKFNYQNLDSKYNREEINLLKRKRKKMEPYKKEKK